MTLGYLTSSDFIIFAAGVLSGVVLMWRAKK
jgi:hypothetical protein